MTTKQVEKTPGKIGRPLGSRNKATAEIMEMAQSFGPDALAVLVDLMFTAENEAARIKAAESVLDRAYGRAPQHIDHDFTPEAIAAMTDKDQLRKIAEGRA